jgi:hypothetical protein
VAGKSESPVNKPSQKKKAASLEKGAEGDKKKPGFMF